MKRLVIMGTVVAVVAGCAGGFKPLKRPDHFPKPEELQQIEAQPAPAQVFGQMDQVRLPEWRLTGPFPEVIGAVPRQAVDELDRLAAAEAAALDNGIATESMRCVARELGAIQLAYGKVPELALRRFIQHRCGSVASHVSTAWVTWDDSELSWADADKDGGASKAVREQITAVADGVKNPEIGAWYGSSDGRAVAMIAVGHRYVDLEPIPTTPSNGGVFDLRGSLFDADVDIVSGVVNHGLYQWERCHALPAKLPRFHLRCQAAPGDLEAGFEIYVQRRGDLLGSGILWQRVWPAGNAPNRYVLQKAEEPVVEEPAEVAAQPEQPVEEAEVQAQTGELPAEALPEPLEPESFDTSEAALRQTILDLVNEARARGKLKPVTLASKQSTASQSLAPHYWKASGEDDRETVNQILYGLLAGWDVAGPIIGGTFFTSSVMGGPRDLVNEFIARPGARDVVFGPDIEQISIGARYESDSQTVGAIVHGWEFVTEETHTKRVNRFLQHVYDARKARGSTKPKKVSALNAYTQNLSEKLASQELKLHQVANQLLERFADANQGKRVMVHYMETHDPTSIEIPEAILNVEPLRVAMVVASYKPANYPWNVYGVVFAYVSYKSATKVAASDSSEQWVVLASEPSR